MTRRPSSPATERPSKQTCTAQPSLYFTEAFPPELILSITRLAHPSARRMRQANKAFRALISNDDVIWAEAGWRTSTEGLSACWKWACHGCHTHVLKAYRVDVLPHEVEEGIIAVAGSTKPDALEAFGILSVVATFTYSLRSKALLAASGSEQVAIVKLLLTDLKAGSKRDEESAEWEQAKAESLVDAAKKGYVEIVKALLDAGVDVHFDDDSALIRAATEGRAEVVKALLDAGANNRSLALQKAVRSSSSVETVKSLVAADKIIHHPSLPTSVAADPITALLNTDDPDLFGELNPSTLRRTAQTFQQPPTNGGSGTANR
ncbi:hypothetical protein HDV00_007332 [Rhizophlyctis rosea]|nr:hypothetical protein HDV00_007332 [Rhizophlyctis rosea]